jgi:hypothetical protein
MENTFYKEHILASILWRTHSTENNSMENTFYGEHILAGIAVAKVVPCMHNLAVLEQHF